ncbi:helix-turn-helix domain-containing protein [Massilia atriviolacea]
MLVADVACFLHADAETIMQLARAGLLPGTRVGKAWIFLRADVLTFLRAKIDEDTAARRVNAQNTAPAAVLMTKPKRSAPPALPALSCLPLPRDTTK